MHLPPACAGLPSRSEQSLSTSHSTQAPRGLACTQCISRGFLSGLLCPADLHQPEHLLSFHQPPAGRSPPLATPSVVTSRRTHSLAPSMPCGGPSNCPRVLLRIRCASQGTCCSQSLKQPQGWQVQPRPGGTTGPAQPCDYAIRPGSAGDRPRQEAPALAPSGSTVLRVKSSRTRREPQRRPAQGEPRLPVSPRPWWAWRRLRGS